MSAASDTPVLSETRRAILAIVKREGSSSIAELARELRLTYENVRQQLGQMRDEGWVEPRKGVPPKPGLGRPTVRYGLTAAGEHFFPKHYDLLSVELIDAVVERFDREGLREILEHLADARVAEWAPRLEGLTLREKVEALRGIYLEDDPFTSVEEGEDGGIRLVERNCPFLNVARERPALCSLTVSILTRLLGYRVVREERFQADHGRCVFRVLTDRPVAPGDFGFAFEEPPREGSV